MMTMEDEVLLANLKTELDSLTTSVMADVEPQIDEQQKADLEFAFSKICGMCYGLSVGALELKNEFDELSKSYLELVEKCKAQRYLIEVANDQLHNTIGLN